MKRYKHCLLIEELPLSVFANNAGLSDFTKPFKKERDKLIPKLIDKEKTMKIGSEANIAKFIEIRMNEDKDYIDIYFLTDSTPKYPKGFKRKETRPSDKSLIANPSKLYTIIVRIKGFFSLLSTSPDVVSDKDISDVLKVADVQFWSSSPSWHWQGINWNMSQLGSSIYPTNIKPTARKTKSGKEIGWANRQKNGFLDKHLQGVVNGMGFYIPQIRMAIKKKLGMTK